MRRSDRQVTEFSQIIDIIRRCDVCRIAVNDGGAPYIVPLNFGMSVAGEKITLYFHSATEGKKLDLFRKDPSACFELDCAHALVSDAQKGYCTMNYESVIGYGVIRFIEDEAEKLAALRAIVNKYHPDGFEFSMSAVPRTAVYALDVSSLTAKARKKVQA
ncbi:MAG: pyridoxamine 5'-phosphate oxidase family protein [Roseburia sp.]|nr:pyridoxamine 5'-phosphate oxidase family protein [Roseburia sp.]